MLWQILLEHFCGCFTVDLVDDVALGACHLPLAAYRGHAVTYSPTSLCLTREQRVGDPIGDDFVVAILISWRRPIIEVGVSSPTPHWEESLARQIFFQPCKEVIDKVLRWNGEVSEPIREDKQANGVSGQVR